MGCKVVLGSAVDLLKERHEFAWGKKKCGEHQTGGIIEGD